MKCSESSAQAPGKSRPRKTRREWPLAPPRRSSEVLYAEVPRNQIALYRFLLEGYDNLAIMSVVDRYRAVIKLRFTPDAERTLRGVLQAQGAKLIESPGRSVG
ncbi:DUF4911 domain-containing protein [Desulfomicrobium sp. ZS1]|uniref:DUF4911 domain-containing protein n=1 Tax=Desulfomicrobium sp. ZS1 TaxID=2952228 RepID=UPI0020B28B4E|nr:DUF4911 domain-containing protein [Desulfomicrobium sp. ZS1]UTF50056.1 DUF4911 domain-containing protein [Desulfomicrobium sp. ZS1]